MTAVVQLPAPFTPPAVRSAGPVTLTALPRTVNLVLYRGDDFAFRLTVTDAAGDPTDLEAATVRAQIRSTPDNEQIRGEFDVGVDVNVVTLRLAADVSATLPDRAVWDVEVQQAGWVTTLAAGTLIVTADVTR